LYLLKRLAYVCFQNRKYAEAEKYFRIVAELMPKVSKNPVNIFNAERNLLLLYTYSDIRKAKAHGERMLADMEDYLPVHNKDLTFMLANINFLAGDHERAKNMYRHVLKLAPKPLLEA
jgi:tetratricopeptide (TPR) repeat protein